MKKDNHIIRLWLMTMLVLIAGSVKAQINLESQLMNATVTWYNDAAATTAITTGTPGVNIYLKIEPATGYWTSAGDLNGKVEKIAGLSGADARRRVPGISQTADVTAVSGQTYAANGAGVYQVTLPALADGQTAEQIEKYVLTGTVNECTAISDATVTNDHATYNGSSVTAAISFNGAVRTKGTDYTVTTGNDARKDYGQESFTITGTGKFKGTANLTLNIDKKEVSLDWGTTNSWVFDTNSHEPAATVGNLVGTDACTVSTYSLTATSGSLTNNEAMNAGSYTITATALSNTNYKLPTAGTTKNFTITGKDVNINGSSTATGTIGVSGVPDGGFTYDGQPHVPTSITVLDENGETIPAGEYTVSYLDSNGQPVTNPTEAETYTVVITDNTGGNYNVSGETTFKINPSEGDLAFANITKTYGDEPFTPTPSSVKGDGAITFISGNTDVITVGSDDKLTIVAASATPVTITANQAAKGDYQATTTTFTVTVNPKGVNVDPSATGTGKPSIKLNGVPDGGFTYDGQPHVPTSITVLDENGETIPAGEYTVSYLDSNGQPVTNPTEADTYTVVITDNTGGNYNVSGSATFRINPAEGDLAFANITKTYGDEPFTPTPSSVKGDGAITFISGNTDVITVGSDDKLTIVAASATPVTITANQAAKGDYQATTTTFTVTVNPKGVNVNPSATGTGKPSIKLDGVPDGGFTYDRQPHVPTSITVLDENGETIPAGEYTVSYLDSNGQPVTNPTEADTYTVVITDNTGGNYNVSGETTFKINPAEGDLAFANIIKTFGDAAFTPTPSTVTGDGAITFTSGNTDVITVSSDGKILTIVAASTTPVTITANQAAKGDYQATTTTFTVTVNPKGVNADGSATATGTIELNGFTNNAAEGESSGSFTYTGKKQVPTVTVKDGDKTLIENTDYTLSYKDSKGNAVEPTNAGTYTVVITDIEGGNYNVSGSATFEIKQAPLTVTAKNKTIYFKDEPANNGVEYKGFVNGEDETMEGVLQGELSYKYMYDGRNKTYSKGSGTGNYLITIEGLSAKNYDITFESGILSVLPKSVNIGGDNTTPGTVVTLDGVEAGSYAPTYNGEQQKPTVSVSVEGQAIPTTDYNTNYGENINAGGTVTITPNPNANIAVSGTVNFNIQKAKVTVIAVAKEKVYGEADPELTYTVKGLAANNLEMINSNPSILKLIVDVTLTREKGEDVGSYSITMESFSSRNYELDSFSDSKLIIKPKAVSADSQNGITVESSYKDGERVPTITVKDGNKALKEGTDYTLTFKDKTGNTVTKQQMEDNPGDYTVEVNLKGNYEGKITADITVKLLIITITPKNDWFTFSSDMDMLLPADLAVYSSVLAPTGTKVLSYQIDEKLLTVNEQRVLKAYNGVLLKGKANQTYTFTSISGKKTDAGTSSYGLTQLIPVVKETHFNQGEIYVLSNNQFLGITDKQTSVPANRAVLKLPTGTNAARILYIEISEETTSVREKVTVNSEQFATAQWYTIDGRKLNGKPTKKGLYICNGVKTVIK